MVVLSSTIFVVVQCAPVAAQDLSRVVNNPLTSLEGPLPINDIQTSGLNSLVIDQVNQDHPKNVLPIDLLLPLGPIRVALSATASTVYNDNIYFSGGRKTADEIATVTPRLFLTNGDFTGHQQTWLVVEYAPQYSRFLHHTQNDALDQNATLNFEWRPADWIFGAKQYYQTSHGPVEEAAARTDRTIYYTNVYAKYAYSPKTSFELDADQYLTEFSQPYFGETKRTLTARAKYAITPKIDLGLEAQDGLISVTDSSSQSYQEGALEIDYAYSQKSLLHLRMGLDVHEFSTQVSDRFDPVFSAEYRYNYSANSRIQVDAYRREENSIVAQNQNYVVTGVALEASEGLLNRLHLGLAAGVNHSSYYATAQVAKQADYNYLLFRPTLECELGALTTLEVFYQYQQNWSSPVNGFRNNIMGANIGIHF